ncbi:hypothetical protein Tco_0435899 [Tanacetum coccineum]
MMSFLSTVVTSRFPFTNNQLRNSSNPRQQLTIHDGRVTVQPVQGDKLHLLLGKVTWQDSAKSQRGKGMLHDRGVAEGPVTQTVITHNAAYQADDLDAYDSDCDDFSTAKAVLMANLSSYGSDVLSVVPHSENTHTDMLNQSVQEMSYSEQTHLVNYPENEITSDSNIIPYSSVAIMIYNAQSGKKFLYTQALQNDLRKFKGKDIVDNAAQVSNATTIAPGMYKLDLFFKQAKSLNPLDSASYLACTYVKLIQELLGYVRDTFPDIHKPSEKLVAEKRLEIGKCNGRINLGKTQREPTFQVVLDALALTPCYSAFLTTADVPEVYMHQFWDSIHKHDTSYKFRMDKKKKFYLNLETFRDIFQICPRVHGQDFDELPTDEVNVSFFKELGHTGKSIQSPMLLWIRCINLGELLLLASIEVYLERHPVLTSFIFLELKFFKECTIRRIWTMLNYFGKISLTRLTTEVTKSKRRCTTLDSPKLSFTTSLPKTRQSLGETR